MKKNAVPPPGSYQSIGSIIPDEMVLGACPLFYNQKAFFSEKVIINVIVNLSPVQDSVKKFFNSENIDYVNPLPGFIPIASVNQGLCQDSFRQCLFEVM